MSVVLYSVVKLHEFRFSFMGPSIICGSDLYFSHVARLHPDHYSDTCERSQCVFVSSVINASFPVRSCVIQCLLKYCVGLVVTYRGAFTEQDALIGIGYKKKMPVTKKYVFSKISSWTTYLTRPVPSVVFFLRTVKTAVKTKVAGEEFHLHLGLSAIFACDSWSFVKWACYHAVHYAVPLSFTGARGL